MFEFYFIYTYVHYSILHRKRNSVLEVQVLGVSGTLSTLKAFSGAVPDWWVAAHNELNMRQIFLLAHILYFQHVLSLGWLFGMNKSAEMRK